MGKDKDKEERETPGGQEVVSDSAAEEKTETAAGAEPGEGENSEMAKEQEDVTENAGQDKKADRKDPKDIQIEEMQDRLMRQMAEFDNFRKRTEKEKSAMYEVGAGI